MSPTDLVRRAAAARVLGLPEPVLRRIVGPLARSPEGWTLDVQSQALLWLMRVAGETAEYVDVDSARRRMGRAAVLLAPRVMDGVRVADRQLPGASGPCRARLYSTVMTGRLCPGLVWFHGGGFVLGSIDSHDGVCRALARRSGVTVVSVEYRLAPEHRFPAGVDDAVAVTRWVLGSGRELGIDPRVVAVGGDSAGGNLAAVVAQTLRDASPPLAFQALVYPPTDATCRQPSHVNFGEGFMLTERTVQWFLDHYIDDRRLETDARVSPLFGAHLAGLPPALVVTAGFDPLRDEGLAYALRMREAGVAVQYVCSEGSLHGFLNTAGAMRESARALALAADAIRRATGDR
jgi:acetyl esterase